MDLIILRVCSNLNDSVILSLWHPSENQEVVKNKEILCNHPGALLCHVPGCVHTGSSITQAGCSSVMSLSAAWILYCANGVQGSTLNGMESFDDKGSVQGREGSRLDVDSVLVMTASFL